MSQNEALIRKCSEMFKFVQTGLLADAKFSLSDAEVLEDVAQYCIGGDVTASYFLGILQTESKVF